MLSPLQMNLLLALDALLCLFCMIAAWGFFGDKSSGSSPSGQASNPVDESFVGLACKVVQTAPLLVEIEKHSFTAYFKNTVVVGELLTIIQIHGDAVAVSRPPTQAGE
jgi:membrane protein implicated in regulation of membrane protease activity